MPRTSPNNDNNISPLASYDTATRRRHTPAQGHEDIIHNGRSESDSDSLQDAKSYLSSDEPQPTTKENIHNQAINDNIDIHNHYEDTARRTITSPPALTYNTPEEIARGVWKGVHYRYLPRWLRDNEFLIKDHRPPLYSFTTCFKSVFRIHSETGNIWTHLMGFAVFLGMALSFLMWPGRVIEWFGHVIQWQDQAVVLAFMVGAVSCLGFSWTFHTLRCHSDNVESFFHKLDYCGISLLIVGSFIPWLYYTFYYRPIPMITYMVLITILGAICIAVSMLEKFAQPKYRSLRAGVYVGLGLSGVVPAIHFVITDGLWEAIEHAALGWLILMAVLYIVGAVIYACRVPEKIWPGKFDIMFQSHQIFHTFVLIAAFVHLYGIYRIAAYRLNTNHQV